MLFAGRASEYGSRTVVEIPSGGQGEQPALQEVGSEMLLPDVDLAPRPCFAEFVQVGKDDLAQGGVAAVDRERTVEHRVRAGSVKLREHGGQLSVQLFSRRGRRPLGVREHHFSRLRGRQSALEVAL